LSSVADPFGTPPEAPVESAELVFADVQVLDLTSVEALPNDHNPALVYLKRGMTPKSKRAMANALLLIVKVASGQEHPPGFAWYPWHRLRYQHCLAIRERLNDRVGRATTNHALCALRGVVYEAWQLKLIDTEDYMRICTKKALPAIKGSSLPAGRYVPFIEMEKLFAHAGEDAIGVRNSALLAVMFGGGLRLAEVAGLEVKDYRPTTGELFVRGKGHKDRLVPLPERSQAALMAWLRVRGDVAGFIFQAVDRHKGATFKESLAEGSFALILVWISQRAGVPKLTPHDTRRTFISDIIDKTGDISIAAELAGHESIETTKRYDRRPEAAKRAAVDKLNIPYGGQK